MIEREQKIIASEIASYQSKTGTTVRERLRKKLPPKPVDPKKLVESYNATLSSMRTNFASLKGSKEIEAQKKAILAMEQSRDVVASFYNISE
jgi:hypothetical protein